jgi:hypothetical protein
MVTLKNDNTTLELSNMKLFKDLFLENDFDTSIIEELFVSGSSIDDFSFLESMDNLKKLVFFACKSDNWNEISGKGTISILRLHNIRQGRDYIKTIDFISKFNGLEYLYLNMLGIEAFPDVTKIHKLHTILCSNRKLIDYSSLENAESLTTFFGWMATDNHRTPAECFIPILKNKNLKAFQYVQMSKVEERKLDKYVNQYCPKIIYPINTIENGRLDNRKTIAIAKLFF